MAGTESSAVSGGPGVSSSMPSKMIEIKLKGFNRFPENSNRWNTNEDIAGILVSAQNHPEWISDEVKMLPYSGTQMIYRRRDGIPHYKQDGYVWKKRKDGKLPREDHMKLKVKGIELIYANYVHSALVPTFHRRAYWLLSNPDVIFVHYLNVYSVTSGDSSEPPLLEKLMNSIRPHAGLPRQELVDQLTPMLCSCMAGGGTVVVPWVEELVERVKTEFYKNLEKRNSCQNPTTSHSAPQKKKMPSASQHVTDSTLDRAASSQILHIPSSVQQIIVQYQVQETTAEPGPVVIGATNRPNGESSVSVTKSATPVLLSVDSASNSGLSESQMPAGVQASSSLGVMSSDSSSRTPDLSREFPIPIGRSSSCSSAFRKGLSSFAMCRQASAFSDTIDDVFLNGAALKAYAVNGEQVEDSSGSYHEDSAYNSFSDQKDLDYLGLIHQDTQEPGTIPISHFRENPVLGADRLPLREKLVVNSGEIGRESGCEESLGRESMALLQRYLNDAMTEGELRDEESPERDEGRRGDSEDYRRVMEIATILDYSPDWSFTEGGVKVLIGGPWYLSGHNYTCLFDGQEVPATLVQTGILRCYSPAHEPGCVNLRVACAGEVISNPVSFTYRSHRMDNPVKAGGCDLSQDQRFVLGLLERLEHMEKFLEKKPTNADMDSPPHRTGRCSEIPDISDLEERFVRICDGMSRLDWIHHSDLPDIIKPASETPQKNYHQGLKILHLAAGLGFSRLIAALLRWRAEKPSSVLNTEVDPIYRDDLGRTPLFLACENGRLGSARLLAEYNQMALRIPNSDGVLPLKEAARRNHRVLVESLVAWAVAKDRRENQQKMLCQAGVPSPNGVLDYTALWVLTGGESITNQEPATGFDCRSSIQQSDACAVQSAQRKVSSEEGVYLRANRRGSTARERTKRASVEGLDALLRQTGETEAKITKQNGADCRVQCETPLSVEIPMDVEVPDSPEMLDMWEQVTSPGAVVEEGVRAQMASLAQQIIDALPDRIKQKGLPEEIPGNDDQASEKSGETLSYFWAVNEDEGRQSDFVNFRLAEAGTPCSSVQSPGGSSVSALMMSPPRAHSQAEGTRTTREGMASQGTDTEPHEEMGAFFNAYRMRKSPLERHFQDLALTDREQRELYEAARIIQTAFRQYKSRVTNQKNESQLESERHAAIVIQSYYRRYKQYCYFKKLHRAALLIQKHFRLHKASKDRDPRARQPGSSWQSSASCSSGFDLSGAQDEEEFWEFAAAAAAADAESESCFRMKVNPEELAQWRKHLAAIRIQHAFRGHYMRKRQAAARKIQKFMRESRQKLQKARNIGGSGGVRVQAERQLNSQRGCRGILDH